MPPAVGMVDLFSKRVTWDANEKKQVLELEPKTKYKIEVINLKPNVRQTFMNVNQEDFVIESLEEIQPVKNGVATHTVKTKDIVAPFAGTFTLETYANEKGKLAKDDKVLLKVNVKSNKDCADLNQLVCGRLFFTPIDSREFDYKNMCEAERAGAKFLKQGTCS